tara:strand:+ start:5807 stop:7249 length:1443 start_codon:yes stop_codon:yes gene_type:complete
MGTGYTRNDGANSIADGNVIEASALDGEFDALLAAFVAATGHTHDGSSAEGGVVTVVGPAQDFVGGAGDFSPKTDSAYDLGKTAVRWATGYIDDLVLTTALPIAQGGTASTTAGDARTALGVAIGTDVQAWDAQLDDIAALAVTNSNFIVGNGTNWVAETGATARASLGVIIGTDVQAYTAVLAGTTASYTTAEETKLAGVEALADVTDTANVTAAGALMDSEVDADIKTLVLPASTTISTFGASLVDDANAAAGLVTLGLSATAAELNALDGITSTVTELNYTDGVTSAIQTQMDTKAPLASPTFTGVPAVPTATVGTDTTQAASTAFVLANSTAGIPSFVIADQKTLGSDGGTSITSWTTRDLNTELYDPDGLVSIAANAFTVTKSGWVEWEALFYKPTRVRTRLYDVTNSAVVSYSLSGYNNNADNMVAPSTGGGQVTAGQTYRIEGIVEVAQTTNGYGIGDDFAPEVFVKVKGWLV